VGSQTNCHDVEMTKVVSTLSYRDCVGGNSKNKHFFSHYYRKAHQLRFKIHFPTVFVPYAIKG